MGIGAALFESMSSYLEGALVALSYELAAWHQYRAIVNVVSLKMSFYLTLFIPILREVYITRVFGVLGPHLPECLKETYRDTKTRILVWCHVSCTYV